MVIRSSLGLIAAAMLCSAAIAQPAPAPTRPAAQAAIVKHAGEWRASKLIGVDVYNAQNEKIGDINEVLLDQSGRVAGVVLGVGGFLGMGEHDVLVKLDQLKFVNEPARSGDRPASDTTRNNNRSARAANEMWYPDHAIMNATKDQLKALPEFKYSNYN
jgi:hypothetical protein